MSNKMQKPPAPRAPAAHPQKSISLSLNIIPGGTVGVSFAPVSVTTPRSASSCIAAGQHGFLYQDPTGVWSPIAAGIIASGYVSDAEGSIAPGKSVQFATTPKLSLVGASLVIDSDGGLIKSSAGAAARRVIGTIPYSSNARSYLSAQSIKIAISSCNVTAYK